MNKFDDKQSGSTVVVAATSMSGTTQTFAYEGNTPIKQILKDLPQATGWDLEPVHVEIETEVTKRSTGFGEGTRVGFSLKEGKLDFERRPKEEVKTTGKIIWRKPEKIL